MSITDRHGFSRTCANRATVYFAQVSGRVRPMLVTDLSRLSIPEKPMAPKKIDPAGIAQRVKTSVDAATDSTVANLRNVGTTAREVARAADDVDHRGQVPGATGGGVVHRQTNPHGERQKLAITITSIPRILNQLLTSEKMRMAALMPRLRALGEAGRPVGLSSISSGVAGNPRYLQPLIDLGWVINAGSSRTRTGSYPTYSVTDLGKSIMNDSNTEPISEMVGKLAVLNRDQQDRLGVMMQKLGGYDQLRSGPANLLAGMIEARNHAKEMAHKIHPDGTKTFGPIETGILSTLSMSDRMTLQEVSLAMNRTSIDSMSARYLEAAGLIIRVSPLEGSTARHALSLSDSGKSAVRRLGEVMEWLHEPSNRDSIDSLLSHGKTLPESLESASSDITIGVSGIREAVKEFPYHADVITRLGPDVTECSELLFKLTGPA